MRTSRPLAALVAAAAATTLVAGLTSPASAATTYDPKPTKTGSAWLVGQLDGGLVYNQEFEFDDLGLSIDFALGLQGAERKPTTVQDITTAFEPHLAEYTSFNTSVFAGQVAKAAVLAIVAHRDPAAFGGEDLIFQLEGLVSTTAPIAGRIEDDSTFGDNANVIGQVHAVRALSHADSPDAAAVLAFLLEQQCDRGFFRESFTADKTSLDQSCQGAPADERAPSVDTTALAVLTLLEVKGVEAQQAVEDGLDWLVDRQVANGSFSSDGKAGTASNSNSTGLAGWALGEGGRLGRAARAAVWLRNLEVPGRNPCAGNLRHHTGAIAYDALAYGKAQGFGIGKKKSDQWRRASSQALPALRWAPRAEGDFKISAPPVVRVGDKLRIRIKGAAPGERVCVTGPVLLEFPGKRAALTQVAMKIGVPTGRRTYTVWLGNRSRQVAVRVTR